jgi:hypothetical protein
MTGPRLVIERIYTSDRVRADFDEYGREVGWTCVPEPPEGAGRWEIFDFSPDSKSGWRRISLSWEPVA